MTKSQSSRPNLRSLETAEFWALYLNEHRKSGNRWLHVVGTVSSWGLLAAAIVQRQWWMLTLLPIAGYGFAWLGHLMIEGNQPVSFRYPVRSLLADYRLTLLMLRGRPLADPVQPGSSGNASSSNDTSASK